MRSELYRTQDGVEYRDLNKNGHMSPVVMWAKHGGMSCSEIFFQAYH